MDKKNTVDKKNNDGPVEDEVYEEEFEDNYEEDFEWGHSKKWIQHKIGKWMIEFNLNVVSY